MHGMNKTGEISRPTRESARRSDGDQAEESRSGSTNAPRRHRRQATAILSATRLESRAHHNAIRSRRSGE
jgi:hypothetical protein